MLHIFILLFSLYNFTQFKTNHQPKIPVKGYKLTWYDEFNGKQLNFNKWNHRGLGKREDAYITKDAVKLTVLIPYRFKFSFLLFIGI